MNILQELAQNLAHLGVFGMVVLFMGGVFFLYAWLGYHAARLTWLGLRATIRYLAG